MEYRRFSKKGFCVRPLSEFKIRNEAEFFRSLLCGETCKKVDVFDVLEHKLPLMLDSFRFEVVSSEELPFSEAEFDPYELCLKIREEVYDGAYRQDAHCRFTIAHEIGHILLHRKQLEALDTFDKESSKLPFCNSEWQADIFARYFLVQPHMAQGMTSKQISAEFGVSFTVANIILEKLTLQNANEKHL